MNWFVNLWQQLPPQMQAILKFILNTHLGETIIVISAFASWLSRRKISRIINRYRSLRMLKNRLPDFSIHELKRGIKYYIWPDCQSVDPSQSDEVRLTVAVRNSLRVTMDRLLKQETVHKHFILLADSGMGKTSFLLNYFARHLRRLYRSFNMALIPLSVHGLEKRLQMISEPEKTVLLLDAFDEDTVAKKDHTKRLADIMQWTRDFMRIVITCRTQFFPRDEELPKETGIIRVGPRGAGEGPQFTFYKIYLSPFSDEQVNVYLKRRFSVWHKKRREAARSIVDKIPNLAVRPMLLTYVDDLIDSGKECRDAYQIYVEMVDAWFERERRQVEDKEALSEFSSKLAVNLFANSESRGGERIPYQEIEPFAEQYGIPLETWQLTGRSLLNRDADGNYKFAHRSILEFLFAQRILAKDKHIMVLAPSLWTGPIKRFLWEGLNGTSLSIPNLFVRFEGGTFNMGETRNPVTIAPFEISNYPVTNLEHEKFDPSHLEERDGYSDKDKQPVVKVSWEKAMKYCKWLSDKTGKQYRLPSEAEWEYAASGGGQREFPWGNEKPTTERANYHESGVGKTTPVGSYPLGMTPEGLFDMAGNVWEWCEDWYDKEKVYRVVRGGAFDYNPLNLRCAVRDWLNPDYRDDDLGFRIVRVV